MRGNPIDDSGAAHIAQMLMVNTALKGLRMGKCSNIGALDFVQCLIPKMPSLEALDLVSTDPLTVDTASAFLTFLEENTVLKFADVGYRGIDIEDKEEFEPKLEYLLRLNRGGRRALTETSLPLSLWPTILGRSSPDKDILFFFLREKHDVLIRRNATTKNTRKRKRAKSDLEE